MPLYLSLNESYFFLSEWVQALYFEVKGYISVALSESNRYRSTVLHLCWMDTWTWSTKRTGPQASVWLWHRSRSHHNNRLNKLLLRVNDVSGEGGDDGSELAWQSEGSGDKQSGGRSRGAERLLSDTVVVSKALCPAPLLPLCWEMGQAAEWGVPPGPTDAPQTAPTKMIGQSLNPYKVLVLSCTTYSI